MRQYTRVRSREVGSLDDHRRRDRCARRRGRRALRVVAATERLAEACCPRPAVLNVAEEPARDQTLRLYPRVRTAKRRATLGTRSD